MLFLVVICLKLSDILPAVNLESAVVSAVNDLFLAYTSTVVAMLGLRATFFIVDEVVEPFSLLKSCTCGKWFRDSYSYADAGARFRMQGACAWVCLLTKHGERQDEIFNKYAPLWPTTGRAMFRRGSDLRQLRVRR